MSNSHKKPHDTTPKILDRTPPYNIEIEMCLLGSLLLKSSTYDDIATTISPTDFFHEPNRIIYEHMVGLLDNQRPLDIAILAERLKQHGDLERVGGVAYLGRLASSVYHHLHAPEYAKTIRDHSIRRAIIDGCSMMVYEAYDSELESNTLLEKAERTIFEISDNRRLDSVMDLKHALTETMDRLDAHLRGEKQEATVESGFHDLDGLTGGFHPRELIVLAARPSMGKTALALNIADHVAIEQRAPVLFVSLEMSHTELIDRVLSARTRVDGTELRRSNLRPADRKKVVRVVGEISEAPLFIDDTPTRTVSQIASVARRLRREAKQKGTRDLGMIVIDYLQLIEPDNPRDPRQEQVARITRRLKQLARDLHVPVLCLAQLNRQTEAAKENRPRLSHLRESGQIEQDADLVMFIHRDDYYLSGEERTEQEGKAILVVAKNRNGPVDDVNLFFRHRYGRFDNADNSRREADFSTFQGAPSDF